MKSAHISNFDIRDPASIKAVRDHIKADREKGIAMAESIEAKNAMQTIFELRSAMINCLELSSSVPEYNRISRTAIIAVLSESVASDVLSENNDYFGSLVSYTQVMGEINAKINGLFIELINQRFQN